MAMPLSEECTDDGKETGERVVVVSKNTAAYNATLFGDHTVTAGTGKACTLAPVANIQQESVKGAYSPQQPTHNMSILPLHSLQPYELQYQWQRLSCGKEDFVKQFCKSRKLLGTNVKAAHEHWRNMVICVRIGPVIEACTLSFSVISTPETTAYLQKHWLDLWHRMDHSTPDYLMVRFMCQYALAWAMWLEDLGTALAKVKACYNDMKKFHPENFFLAPYYTVTIGRWIYEGRARNGHMTYGDIMEVQEYADETLRLIATLEEDWAKFDTFGAKLSALHLLLLVADYYRKQFLRFSASCIQLHKKIDHLYTKISKEFFQNCSRVVVYDQAWFHSVSATYYLFCSNNATTQEEKDHFYDYFQQSAAESANLYYRNGRYWRARQEAERTGDPHIIQEYSRHCENAPCV